MRDSLRRSLTRSATSGSTGAEGDTPKPVEWSPGSHPCTFAPAPGATTGDEDIDAAMASEKQNTTKERILDAAVKLFAERGYLGAGVCDLEEAVGIRRGALYYHIESKENVLFEIVSRSISEMNSAAWAIVGTGDWQKADGCPLS